MLIATPKVKLNHKVFRPVIIGLMFIQELDTNSQFNIIWLRLFEWQKKTFYLIKVHFVLEREKKILILAKSVEFSKDAMDVSLPKSSDYYTVPSNQIQQ